MSTASISSSPTVIPRGVGTGLAGACVFGVAAGLGHGAPSMLHGAWMAPALFVGGALLATPPLYLASTHAGRDASAESIVAEVANALEHTGLCLLGLAAPAAFFSATLRTPSAVWLLLATVVLLGALGLRAVARRTLARGAALWLWSAFALALGLRLIIALAHHSPLTTQVIR